MAHASTSGSRAKMRATTIKDVAREAGVGLGTASRALGSGELVRASTRARILAAAERVGYRPSRAAQVLRGARARVIGVMIPDVSLPLYGQWLRGAGEAARQAGYVLLVCDGQHSVHTMMQQLDRLYEEQIDGLVLAGAIHALPRIESFFEAGIPVAPALSRSARQRLATKDLRESSERPAVLAAFRRLVALGHRRIAYFAHTERDLRVVPAPQRMRIQCLRESLAEVGAELDDGLVALVHGVEECVAAASRIATTCERPTAFIPGTEALTPAVLLALTATGLRVPSDASVLGFGDSLWEQAFSPPISVVRFDYAANGRAMVENVIAQIEGVRPAPPLPNFPSEFVERGSCAAAPRMLPGSTKHRR